MPVEVKICGLTTATTVDAAVQGGARYVGFVFFPASPRSLDLGSAAALARRVPSSVLRVGLTVDADDELLAAIVATVPLDLLQLHGREAPARVAGIRRRFGLPVTKAIGLAAAEDLASAAVYEEVADQLLFDARAPVDATRPGGNARSFPWAIVNGYRGRLPWILAGGLHAANLEAAVRASGAHAVDVSSGVEVAPGVKSIARIGEFLRVAHRLDAAPYRNSSSSAPASA